MKRSYFAICLFLLFWFKIFSSHIVGGEIYYDHLGGSIYKITLKVYRDCFNGVLNFDGLPNSNNTIIDPTLTVFDGNGNYVTQVLLRPPTVNLIPPSINNSCITAPGNVCLEEGVYIDTVNLPPKIGGYYLVYQRCCRSTSALNILNVGVGDTFYEHIPGIEVTTNNSSPRFLKLPPIFVCNGKPIGFNHAAIDPDGDSLVYSLCAPFDGLDPCCGNIPIGGANTTVTPCAPKCPPLNKPPYTPVTFVFPYSSSYPLASNPVININSSTGYLNGTPNLNGDWIVGVCVKEYRGGILIGIHYRDYMFSVVNCIIQVASIIKPQSGLCAGNTINFVNQSIGGTVYHWDFGVNTLTNDTSNLLNPSYTFPDTGKYVVTLIVNPGKPCADTSRQTFYIYPALAPTFTSPPPQCFKNNSFNFSVGGSFASYSIFNWNFGPVSTPSTSTVQNPTGITFSAPGYFPIKLIVKQAVCSYTLTDTAVVYQNPAFNFIASTLNICDSIFTTLNNISATGFPTKYTWHFSDGTNLSGIQPSHMFSPTGVYDLTLTVISDFGYCIDTTLFVVKSFIVVNPKPNANFSFLPTSTTIFDPDIYFFDESSGATGWYYNFGDGNSSTMTNPSNHYNYYGDFNVMQTVSNNFNCIDSITKTVKILPEFRFWVPNCFTPGNKDSLNDIFLPIVYGVTEYNFYIYNRWGELIFKTTDPMEGWDGKFRGSESPQGEYSWVINFKNDVSLRHEQHSGSLMLLK